MTKLVAYLCGLATIPVVYYGGAILWILSTSFYKASRDASKWIKLPCKDGMSGWRKLYAIPRLWLWIFKKNMTSVGDFTVSPKK